ELFPDDNQKYTITAEVIDQSRRTIVGNGTVLVSKEPFKVYTWVDRGYYEPNQQINSFVQARRMDGKPVSGDAAVKIYKIKYGSDEENTPTETEVFSTNVKLNEEGSGKTTFNAAEPGQYRISYVVTASTGTAAADTKQEIPPQEGGYILCVYGPKQSGSGSFEFNQLELMPNKQEYAPGEEVQLRINTNRPGSTVLLFLRPTNGVYLAPQILRLEGKSTEVKIPVAIKDMPNFFVEAVTVSNGQTYTESKEIVVPPEKRILNVEVRPSSKTYRPGEKAKAELVVTDLEGKPVVGSTVVSIYDKSVEYISGGSNVGDIKDFFWKWRRQYYPNTLNNLERYSGNITPPNQQAMQYLGIFGFSVADELGSESGFQPISGKAQFFGGDRPLSRKSSGMGMMGGGMGGGMMAPMAAMDLSGEMSDMKMESNSSVVDLRAPGVYNADMSVPLPQGKPETGGLVEATIRKNFADTALWVGALETNCNGIATIELDMPENLTTWKINVWSMSPGTRVGYGSAEVITRKDLIIRMQTPRFLVQKDKSYLTAIVHNYLSTDKNVKVSLELEGKELAPNADTQLVKDVKVPAGGEARVDWLVDAVQPGDATILMKALTDEESDAIQNKIPVYVHGMLKQEAWSGWMKPSVTEDSVKINVPAERRPEETRLTVRFSPTLAGAMIDALPYLVDYPYGCTEQTLNRFLPTVITQKVLIDTGV
ncbi:MAG: alpha-2-macroglobulin family protein, partial [Thermoguttaceae bacterium]